MRIIPVLDLKARLAVHAVAGDRAHYEPLTRRLHAPTETADARDPLAVADDYRRILGLNELYLADLDAIEAGLPSLDIYEELQNRGHRLWLDPGIRSAGEAQQLAKFADVLILGSESIGGPELIARIVQVVEPSRLAFSLDLREGVPVLSPDACWPLTDPAAIVEQAITVGIGRVILLDLARVGTGRGVGTNDLLERLSRRHPSVEWVVGGGLASAVDVQSLARQGASAALVGSALRDGRIGVADLRP